MFKRGYINQIIIIKLIEVRRGDFSFPNHISLSSKISTPLSCVIADIYTLALYRNVGQDSTDKYIFRSVQLYAYEGL